ncbi:MAG TPA: hypothetical protein VFJ17_05040 [Mycobacteriales bacterium]|nr:hypothetical protein [Mycobacteriales bacterium]
MRSSRLGTASGVRLWWTVPLGLVLLTAVVFVAVVLPALASAPDVPSQLVVRSSPAAAPTPTATTTPSTTRSSASPSPLQSTTVVVPVQPVVRETEDRHDDGVGSPSGEPRDR